MAKAEKGDLIRIVDAVGSDEYKNGEIYEVIGEESGLVEIDLDYSDGSGKVLLDDEEYVIHRKAGEEDDSVYLTALPPGKIVLTPKQEAVNSPNHYTQGRFETIEIIEEITKGYEDGYVAYCVGNALKYLARAPFKHGEPTEDLAKAERYLAFANAYLTQSTE